MDKRWPLKNEAGCEPAHFSRNYIRKWNERRPHPRRPPATAPQGATAQAFQPRCGGLSHVSGKNGGAEGDRTPDLCNAIAALSQLSYGPEPFSPPLGRAAAAPDSGKAPDYRKLCFPAPSTPPAAALRINFGKAEGRDPALPSLPGPGLRRGAADGTDQTSSSSPPAPGTPISSSPPRSTSSSGFSSASSSMTRSSAARSASSFSSTTTSFLGAS